VDELVDTVSEKYGGEKVIALGHSLGGFLSFMVRNGIPLYYLLPMMMRRWWWWW